MCVNESNENEENDNNEYINNGNINNDEEIMWNGNNEKRKWNEEMIMCNEILIWKENEMK